MIRIVIGVVRVVGVMAAVGATYLRKCSVCNKRLSFTTNCLECNESVCSSCSISISEIIHRGYKISSSGYVCSDKCKDTHVANCKNEIDKIDSQIAVKARAANVKLYSENYKGKQDPKLNKRISSKYFITIEEAEDEIKFIAASNGVDYIYQVQRNFRTEADGNYRYKEWILSGII